jgi:hypothetical protein
LALLQKKSLHQKRCLLFMCVKRNSVPVFCGEKVCSFVKQYTNVATKWKSATALERWS